MPRASTGSAASPSKRPRDRDGDSLQVLTAGPKAELGPITNDLSSFLAPMDKDDFMSGVFRQKALAIKAHPSHRDERLSQIKALLRDMNPNEMLQNSNSAQDGISVWLGVGEKDNGEPILKSIKVPPTEAKTLYDAGHALYFRATEELEDSLVPGYAQSLGCGFGTYFRDGQRRGEIEVFAAHPGHTTGWHFDFQENFTVQLRGRKKWSVMKSGINNPHRACATHFSGPENVQVLHGQHQVHRLDSPAFCGVPSDIEEQCESVLLQAGDVLYHPAGIWHKVETVDGEGNSLSINVSLFPLTWVEFMQESLQQLMMRQAMMRERMVYTDADDARQQLARRITTLEADIKTLQPNHVIPDALANAFEEGTGRRTAPPLVALNEDGSLDFPTADGNWGQAERPAKVLRSPLAVLSVTEEFFAPPVMQPALSDSDDDEEGEDEDEESSCGSQKEMEVELPEDHVRFDMHSNFIGEDSENLGTPPAVHCPMYVHKKWARALTTVALLAPGKATAVKTLGIPKNLVSFLLEAGYFAAADE